MLKRWIGSISIILVFVAGTTGTGWATEMEFRTQTMATVSDNIDRAQEGSEMSGSRLIQRGDIVLSQEMGKGDLRLSGGGGWEETDSDTVSNTDSYNFRLEVNIPWSGTGYLKGSAGVRDETVDPEPTAIDQSRVKTKTKNSRAEIGRQQSPTFRWWTALSHTTEKRFDRDFEQSRIDFGWNLEVSRTRSLEVTIGANEGTEDVGGDSWTGASLSLDVSRRSDRLTSGGYRLSWDGQDLETGDGSTERSDKVTGSVYYGIQTSSTWSLSCSLGMEGVKPANEERRWEPYLELGLSGTPASTVQVNLNLSSTSEIQDPVEEQVAWTSNSQAGVEVKWEVSKSVLVVPRVLYIYSELYGNAIADRNEETVIAGLGVTWSIDRHWSIHLSGHSENRDSSQNSFDLTEERVDLNISGTFL